jgi:hypothetical protein
MEFEGWREIGKSFDLKGYTSMNYSASILYVGTQAYLPFPTMPCFRYAVKPNARTQNDY